MPLVPGTYVSEDGIHTVIIDTVDNTSNSFTGSFESTTPLGDFTYKDAEFFGISDYSANQNTWAIGWSGRYRSNSWDKVMYDKWAGCTDSSSVRLIMSGSRAYTTSTGSQEVFSFENVIFNREGIVIPSGDIVDTDSRNGLVYNLQKDRETGAINVKKIDKNNIVEYIAFSTDDSLEPIAISVQGDYNSDDIFEINVLAIKKTDGVYINIIKEQSGNDLKIIDNSIVK